MAKGFAIHNAPTDHGGIIPSTQMRSAQMGNLFVRAGDGHFCPKCNCWSTVIKSHDHIIFDDKAVAYVGDKLTCGAKILPQQSHVVGESGGNSNSVFNSTLEAKNSQINSFTNNIHAEEKYENYYIEQDKTNIFKKFITILPPYDSDGKGFSILHSLSGVISFFINYVLKGTKLFISISAYTDPLNRNAAVFPYATAYISRDQKQIAIKKVDDTTGLWNLDNGRVPVGSAEINLPKSNLSLVTVELKLGYAAQITGSGVIYPIPAFTTFTFTLTSIAKRIS